ncbi:hypothetical protein ACFWOJ_33685 [Streptomyces sp. NPDC058439]|uniref:hypothetical protein n=1 Tax=Streptomyces sp. NPDC058439 TaxID=3346500 RepID=UPI00365330BE
MDTGRGPGPGARQVVFTVLVEVVVAKQPQYTVVLVLGGRDGRRRLQEPVGAVDLLGDPGQLGGVQHGEDIGDGGVRSARVRGESGQGLGPAVLGHLPGQVSYCTGQRRHLRS